MVQVRRMKGKMYPILVMTIPAAVENITRYGSLVLGFDDNKEEAPITTKTPILQQTPADKDE